MPAEPIVKRAVAFIDGQNLYHSARDAFGYSWPNYDPLELARAVCRSQGWEPIGVRFYTGIPDPGRDPVWHHFWEAKFAQMKRRGVWIFSRPLKYREKTVDIPGGGSITVPFRIEKGVDVRLALEVVRACREGTCDVPLIFSQDQDFSEVAEEIRAIAREQGRWIRIASAFPVSPTYASKRGIDKTDWIRIDRKTYDACIDQRNYRPKKGV